jgi:hypothetical protein
LYYQQGKLFILNIIFGNCPQKATAHSGSTPYPLVKKCVSTSVRTNVLHAVTTLSLNALLNQRDAVTTFHVEFKRIS